MPIKKYKYDVKQIESLLNSGLNMEKIAKVYGEKCNRSVIHSYLKNNGYVIEMKKIYKIKKVEDQPK